MDDGVADPLTVNRMHRTRQNENQKRDRRIHLVLSTNSGDSNQKMEEMHEKEI